MLEDGFMGHEVIPNISGISDGERGRKPPLSSALEMAEIHRPRERGGGGVNYSKLRRKVELGKASDDEKGELEGLGERAQSSGAGTVIEASLLKLMEEASAQKRRFSEKDISSAQKRILDDVKAHVLARNVSDPDEILEWSQYQVARLERLARGKKSVREFDSATLGSSFDSDVATCFEFTLLQSAIENQLDNAPAEIDRLLKDRGVLRAKQELVARHRNSYAEMNLAFDQRFRDIMRDWKTTNGQGDRPPLELALQVYSEYRSYRERNGWRDKGGEAVANAWLEGVRRNLLIAREAALDRGGYNGYNAASHKRLMLEQKYLGTGTLGAPMRGILDQMADATLVWEEQQGRLRKRTTSSSRRIGPTQATGGQPWDVGRQSGEMGMGMPDYLNAPEIHHDDSFFDESFLEEWGIPKTFYKQETFGGPWIPVDVVGLLRREVMGTAVDKNDKAAFEAAIAKLDSETIDLFYRGFMPVLELRKLVNGSIEIFSGDKDGTGSIIKAKDVKKMGRGIARSPSALLAFEICCVVSGKQVANSDREIATGVTVASLAADLRAKYSHVVIRNEKGENETINIFGGSDGTSFNNKEDKFQGVVAAVMEDLKVDIAKGAGICLGAVEAGMVYRQMWGGDMGNWRWGQMEDRYGVLVKKGYLDDHMDRMTALYDRQVRSLSDILGKDGAEAFVNATQLIKDDALYERWNYLNNIRTAVLEPARLMMNGTHSLVSGTRNSEERAAIAVTEFRKNFNGAWGFKIDDVVEQIKVLPRYQGKVKALTTTSIGVLDLPGFLLNKFFGL